MKKKPFPMPPGHGPGKHGGDGRLPPHIEKALSEAGLDCSYLLYSVTGDMDDELCYTDTVLAFDAKGIYFACGRESLPGEKRKEKKYSPSYTLERLESVPFEKGSEIRLEEYVSTGRLILTQNGESKGLTRFSIGKLAAFSRFEQAFNSFSQTGEIKIPEKESPVPGRCIKCGAPTPPGRQTCRKCSKNSSTAVRLSKFFGGYKKQIALILLGMLMVSALSVFVPQISTRSLFDDILANPSGKTTEELTKAIGVLVLSILAIKLINVLFNVLQQYITAAIVPDVTMDIKTKIFAAMQKLSVGFYTSKQTGSLMERVTRDADHIFWFFLEGIPSLIIDTVTIIGIIAVMFSMNVRLSVVIIIAMPVIGFTMYFTSRLFRSMHHTTWRFRSRLSSQVSDSINGQRVIKAFAREDSENERFEEINGSYTRAQMRLALTEASIFPLIELTVMIISALVTGYGAYLVSLGRLQTGELLTFIVYLGMLREPFRFFSRVSDMWARCADSAERVFEVCDAEPDIADKPNAKEASEIEGRIELRNVGFGYEPARPVLKNISLKIEPGSMLGIVGKTGAGKTTIASLTARLYDPAEGSIFIDGTDLRDIKLSSLRNCVGMVSQDIYLFMGTIADNIKYARPDATMDEVIAAAKAANAHDFIMKMPDAYETRVGAGGQKLSGGETQRISIARTIIQNPKILILDEATAAMDTQTERKIQQSLSELKTGRTTISIAHRLSTLRDADMLAVISDGEITEYGSFPELITLRGEFYKQYRLQSEALSAVGIGDDTDTDIRENDEKEDKPGE